MRRLPALFGLLSILIFSCGHNRLDVDVSSITVPEVKIQRFDHDFFKIDTNNITASLNRLRSVYGGFADGYLNNIVCYSAHDSLGCDLALRDFMLSYDLKEAEKDCDKIFSNDFSSEEAKIKDAFRHYKYYFPKDTLPRHIYASMNGFAYNFVAVNGDYGIGLEYYLGNDNEFYKSFQQQGITQWSAYKCYHYRREYLVADFIHAWMTNTFLYNPSKNDLVSRMIYEGKLLYMSRALLRDTPDTIILQYTKKQLDWCTKNEAMMWSSLIKQQKVFSEDEDDIEHYVGDGPFTPGFPHDSPGRAGAWIGLRIVETFMDNNPKVTLQDMMKMQDGEAFLNQSKYKPKF